MLYTNNSGFLRKRKEKQGNRKCFPFSLEQNQEHLMYLWQLTEGDHLIYSHPTAFRLKFVGFVFKKKFLNK